MIDKTVFSPDGSEITSPLAEHFASLVMSARGHVVEMMNTSPASGAEHHDFMIQTAAALSALESMSDLLSDHVFKSSTLT